MISSNKVGLFLLAVWLLAGCQPGPMPTAGFAPEPVPVEEMQTVSLPEPSLQLPAASTTPPLTVPSVTATPTPDLEVCSPLEGIEIKELPTIQTNPYDPPLPGRDDGHHGVDFAFYTRGERSTIHGLAVHSVLAGRVAAAVSDRPPYGNFVIIETPLEKVPVFTQLNITVPTPLAMPLENSRLQCPPVELSAGTSRSLYLLYAHLDQPSDLQPGEDVSCGQSIGQVGNSGASGNPHLHLELRAGPADVVFPVMAHYVNDATTGEMGYYCEWRISGHFQLMDPFEVLNLFLLGSDPFP